MARILYGLCGVGIGHAIRARVIIEHLKKKNNVMVVCSHRPYSYLSRLFKNVHKIEGFELAFKNNSIVNYLTFLMNLKKLSNKTFKRLDIVRRIIDEFKPDVVISDWESFTSLLAKRYRIPLISIDNQHFLIKGRFEFPKKHILNYIKAKIVLMFLIRNADYYIISSFYETSLKKSYKNIFLVPPILRKEILNARPRDKDYILVYQSTKTYEKLIEILKETRYKFIIYGYDADKRIKNLRFKRFNERQFIKDLVNCKAVICNGGFTLISESIHLKKPILSVPIKGHFEQILNAMYVKLRSHGMMYNDLDEKKINNFMDHLDEYRNKGPVQKNNSVAFGYLDRII